MIFNYLYTLPNSTTDFDTILVDTVTVVPFLPHFLLAMVFFVIFLGGVGRQKLRTGTADYPMWAVIGSIAMFMITLIMTMVEGLIRLDILVIVIVITIFSGVWLFLDHRAGEL